jgi:VanZ family protein
MRASPLARILFGIYIALAVYASLYPLEGWRAQGSSAFEYLSAPWPRYVTAFDLSVNVLGYVPYGFLCVAALLPRVTGALALMAALVSAAALSALLEAAQSFLPSRVATNLDLVCNIAGAGLGAAIALVTMPRLVAEGPLKRLRAEAFLPGTPVDAGLALLGLWLFTQLNPATLLFAAGDLRYLLAATEGAHRARTFVTVEALTAAANLMGVGLLVSVIAREQPHKLFVALVLAALAVKTAAFAILMRAEDVLAWLTPGAQIGLATGLTGALALMRLPRTARLALAGVLIMAATVLVNLAPANPYLAASLRLWQQGHFLNFNGLTRLVSGVWAFAALAYVIYLAARRREAVG